MIILRSALLLLIIPVFCVSNACAQDNPNLEIGLKPYGSFRGGNIDSVSMNNGNLFVRIPLWSIPQRGGVGLSFSVVYNNKGYSVAKRCPPTGCYYQWTPKGLFGFQLADDQAIAASGKAVYQSNGTLLGYTASAGTSDGAVHQMGQKGTSSQWETLDGTGIEGTNFHIDSGSGAYLFDSVIGRDGVRHHYPNSQEGSSACSTDSNGNQVTCTFAGNPLRTYTDTLGRIVGPSTSSTDFSNCSGPLPITSATILTFPAPAGGTATFKLCYANLSLQTRFSYINIREFSGISGALQSIVLPNLTTWTFIYDNTGFGDLTKVIFPTDGSLAYTWGTQSLCHNAYPIPGVTPASRVVSSRSLDANDGIGPHTSNYVWGPDVDTGSSRTRIDTVTDAVNNDTAYTETGLGYSCSFFETHREEYQGTGTARTLLKTTNTDYTWSSNQFNALTPTFANTVLNVEPTAVTTIWPNGETRKDIFTYDTGFTYKSPLASSSTQYNATYGTLLTKNEYDFGAGAAGSLLRQTVTSFVWQPGNPNYQSYVDGNFLELPKSVITNSGSGYKCSETDFGYDDPSRLSSPNPPITTQHVAAPGAVRGNLTSTTRLLSTVPCQSGATWTSTPAYSNVFDTGMISASIDPMGHTTQYLYSSTFSGAYVTSTQYPDTNSPNLSHHIISGNYDSNTGLLTSFIDENGNATNYAYDNMKRFTTVTYPSPSGGTVNFYYPDAVTVEQTKQIDASRTTDLFVRFDGVGREVRRVIANDETTPWDQVDSCYDASGRLAFKAYPYQGTGLSTSSVCSGAGDAFAYDGLGRTITVTHSENSAVLTSYTGRATSVSDEGNGTQRIQRISQIDGLGRTISLCEVASLSQLGGGGTPAACGQDIAGTGFLTSYVYDPLDNLTSVTQGTLSPRTFQYDSLSRLGSATNPESGNITYAYDNDGLLITRTAPKPNQTSAAVTVITTLSYDSLHRLRGKSYNDGLTPTATMNYDETSALGTTGLLNTTGHSSSSSIAGSQAREVFSYDKLGRITLNSQCTPHNCGASTLFPINYTYDLLGDMRTSTNGFGVTLTYTLNRATRLTNMTSSLSDANHPGVLYSSAHFNSAGSLLSASLGNGIGEILAYDGRLRLASITDGTRYSVSIPTSPSGYAPNGDVLTANDSVNGNWTYAYDAFNRIASASATGQAYTYAYDRYGNRWQQNGPHTSSLGFGNDNRIVSGSGVTYDAAGNVTANGAATYFYDAENRLVQVGGALGVCSGATACYVYDANGRRIRKTTGSTTVDFLYDIAGHQIAEANSSGNWNRGEVYAGGKHLATYAGGTTYFIHSDWLGTERARTTAAGAAYETCTSLVFGDWLTCTGGDPSPMHFTGKEHDSESGLDNFGARYDSSSMGRFMQPDPLLNSGQTWNPQSWNRYAYTEHNPQRYTDPTGLYKFGDCTGTAEQCIEQEQRSRDSIAKPREPLKGLDPNSNEAKKLKKTLDKLGDEDDGNIKINFGDAGKTDGLPNLGKTNGNNITINYGAVDNQAKNFNLNASERAALDAGVTTHEGAHAGAGKGPFAILGMHGEHAAYFNESVTYQGLHNTDRTANLWNESWLTVDKDKLSIEKDREHSIQQAIHPPKPEQKHGNP